MSRSKRSVCRFPDFLGIGIVGKEFLRPFLVIGGETPVIFQAVNAERKHEHCTLKAVFPGGFRSDFFNIEVIIVEIFGDGTAYKRPAFIAQIHAFAVLLKLAVFFCVFKTAFVDIHFVFLSGGATPCRT